MRFKPCLLIIFSILSVLFPARGNDIIIRDGDSARYVYWLNDSTAVAAKDIKEYLNDTSAISAEERNKRFYDSLAVKSNRNFFSRTLYKLLIVPSSSGPERKDPEEVTDAAEPYRQFAGKRIANIEFVRHNVFESPTSYLEKATNAVHVKTRERAVRRDILFKPGELVDPDVMAQNKQLLMSRRYLYDAQIELSPVDGDTTAVNIKVTTNDSWTINADLDIRGLTGRMCTELSDVNLLGTGNRFRYKISNDWKEGTYEGSNFEYYVPNLFGSFYTANFTAGRSFKDIRYSALINKRFIRRSDYELGVEAIYNNSPYGIVFVDDALANKTAHIKYGSLDVWAGKSFRLPDTESSIYALARAFGIEYSHRDFSDDYAEPLPPLDVSYWKNPSFHNRKLYLGSAGIYKEKFKTANLIYGYGFTEYVATGYKAELIGGYMDGEFESGPYGGVTLMGGDFTRLGYFMGSASIGSFYNKSLRRAFQSTISLQLDYFTNMIPAGVNNIRQFIRINYLKGINREEGAQEWIRLNSTTGPRDIYVYTYGRERLAMNAETVLFTRWQPLGFRVALYGFLDAAFIGSERNIFRNDFYSAIGIGIRLKNEMFVFSTIQLSLSIALNKNGLIRNDWIMLDFQQRMQSPRYIPERPMPIAYM